MALCPIGLSNDQIEAVLEVGRKSSAVSTRNPTSEPCWDMPVLYNINILRSPGSPLDQSAPEFPNWHIRAAIQLAARQERQRGSRGVLAISRDLRQEEVKRENAGSGNKVTPL
jgi:hypothetical protein